MSGDRYPDGRYLRAVGGRGGHGGNARRRARSLESTIAAFESWCSHVEATKEDVKASVDHLRGVLTRFSTLSIHVAPPPFDRDAGILGPFPPATECPPATVFPVDGPDGNRMDFKCREHGFGHVFAQTHLTPNGMTDFMFPLPFHLIHLSRVLIFVPMGRSLVLAWVNCHTLIFIPSTEKISSFGKVLVRTNFLCMWCILYVDQSGYHAFFGVAARWLQSVEPKLATMSWEDFGTLIHDRFWRINMLVSCVNCFILSNKGMWGNMLNVFPS